MRSRQVRLLTIIACALTLILALSLLYHSRTNLSEKMRTKSTAVDIINGPADHLIGQFYENPELLGNTSAMDLKGRGIRLGILKKLDEFLDKLEDEKGLHEPPKNMNLIQFIGKILNKNLLPHHLERDFNSRQHRKSFKGQGIVSSASPKHLPILFGNLKTVRHFGCNLPVEVYHLGDLNEEHAQRLKTLGNLQVFDLRQIFNNDIVKFHDFDTKVFGLLACSFREAILIDADISFLQTPERLFEQKAYRETGSLFFHDRSLTLPARNFENMINQIPDGPSAQGDALIKERLEQQDSGVVVVDKQRHYYAIQMVAILNTGEIRNNVYSQMYGDKETFWWGFEIAKDSEYVFSSSRPGAIGEILVDKKESNYTEVGGPMLQFDEDGRPFFWNGQVYKSKYDHSIGKVNFQAWKNEDAWSFRTGSFATSHGQKKCHLLEGDLEEWTRINVENADY